MNRPLVLFDLTRLLSATGRAAPTGIERVEFHYAKWLISLSDIEVKFVATLSSSIRLVPDASVHAFLMRQSQTWSEGAEGFSSRVAVDNIGRFLSGRAAPPAPKLGHLSPEERRLRRSAQKARVEGSNPITSWAQQMAASFAHDPLQPVLRRASSRRQPVIYLRASGDRLENSAPFEKLKAEGVKMVVMTYDTIPLDFPEFVRPKAAQTCATRVGNMARLADGIIAISHYSAGRLAPYLLPFNPKVTVAHLGTDEPLMPKGSPSFADHPYFLVDLHHRGAQEPHAAPQRVAPDGGRDGLQDAQAHHRRQARLGSADAARRARPRPRAAPPTSTRPAPFPTRRSTFCAATPPRS